MIQKAMQITASLAGTFKIGGDLPIHRLGFGALQIIGSGAWGEPKDRKEVIALLRRVIELGVNIIDTADSYGPEISEDLIAQALYPYPKGLVIATKGGCIRPGPDQWTSLCRPDYLKQCVEMSLRRLKLDCIDLYQLHDVDPTVPIEDSVGALKDLQKQGKIRHIGLSNVRISHIEKAKKIANIVSIQNLYNLADRSSEDILKYCENHNIAFIPWFPLANKALAHPGGRIEMLARQKGVTPAQIALAWLLKHSKVMVPIPGTSSIKHLEENIASASIQLTDSDTSDLEG